MPLGFSARNSGTWVAPSSAPDSRLKVAGITSSGFDGRRGILPVCPIGWNFTRKSIVEFPLDISRLYSGKFRFQPGQVHKRYCKPNFIRLDFIIRGRTYEASVDLRTAGRLFEAPPFRLSEANMKSSYQKDHIKEFRERICCIKNVIKNGECSSDDVNFGIGGNTFRALTGFNNPPSETYRQWACKRTRWILRTGASKEITGQKKFDEFHKKSCISLKSRWKRIEKDKELKFAHQYKMVDLYFKWLCTNIDWLCINDEWQKKNKVWIKNNSPYRRSAKSLSRKIIKYGHCPLDRKSLITFNKCSSKPLKIKNPSNPSMGSIHNKKIYDDCQRQIRIFAKYYGGTSFLFDFYVWPPSRRWIWPGKDATKKPTVW